MLFFNLVAFSQTETLVLEKEEKKSIFPHVKQYYHGEIPIDFWLKNNQIELNDELKVYSFLITFPAGKQTVEYQFQSDSIPLKVLEYIKISCLNEEVFINQIKAIDLKGELFIIPSMSLTPIIDEE